MNSGLAVRNRPVLRECQDAEPHQRQRSISPSSSAESSPNIVGERACIPPGNSGRAGTLRAWRTEWSSGRKNPLGPGTYHLCVDMQRMFAERTEWHLPWMDSRAIRHP